MVRGARGEMKGRPQHTVSHFFKVLLTDGPDDLIQKGYSFMQRTDRPDAEGL